MLSVRLDRGLRLGTSCTSIDLRLWIIETLLTILTLFFIEAVAGRHITIRLVYLFVLTSNAVVVDKKTVTAPKSQAVDNIEMASHAASRTQMCNARAMDER